MLLEAPMSRSLTLVVDETQLAPLVESAVAYADEATASSTRRKYVAAFHAFEVWCVGKGVPSLPAAPTTVAVYLAALADAGKRPNTISGALAGIAFAHRDARLPWEKGHPAIKAVIAGIRRRLGVAVVQKTPILDTDLLAMVVDLGVDLSDLRDRAVLTLGFMGAFRRSELTALDVADLEARREGYLAHVRRSKTDQEGEGAFKAIPYTSEIHVCPVRALRTWLGASGITEGPVFRAVTQIGGLEGRLEPREVARIVKRRAIAAGLDPARFAGHSLRAGFVTMAAKKGKTVDAIMRQTGHKNPTTVAKYVRLANAFEQSAAVGLM
jgi:integrase